MLSIFDAGAFDLTEEAPAKINLALHVTGLRGDGYHLLDMLVTFTDHGDRLGFRSADADGFEISGRFATSLGPQEQPTSNLVIRARDLLRQASGGSAPPVMIHLEKSLPIASGIGGGSADAAAALRGLMRLWNITLTPDKLKALALQLGADVPMCLTSRPLIARGIGEEIDVLPDFPSFGLLIGNPLVGVSTPAVFRQLREKNNPPFGFEHRQLKSSHEWLSVIDSLRNDLEPPARALCPEIGELSVLMAGQRPRLVRMSGSGASCFALFDDLDAAKAAAASLHSHRPDWYFQATQTTAGDLR
ncbi:MULTISPECIES: 4-(cytidine 5'-diphospho)-2-C-methyl-D-erythritol kinase [unclassified Rhizobium]|uniref:4-(cytidine 5'-diphospho)-2-C-methyl-D-erythritol kinase n=1 Tax=unclassified Rhizobium TaxID=2613769 RepID=UPI001ADC059A|nr:MULTISPECIES: 4-(cytidine 5'-diphospho)-2-C-methyl-D-erythritol kinase [unclassified Rhizobium]MBO9097439.1 4-(cytidine 5'-diphospho)-2-C-methyl-D-erythritol kinase [Rhizobium sp. L58/93]MBO9133709.1 4-(cytidine 5'-diphospho)-2-C-methyl-D-erythritol kinase [Rhizobium sp. B209b/85]MBO9167678.1 4-(cytidine 5'-diphospho)-2-C-methyl-D-erythritol kinase [Rhizobium sp. L245/93]MBO9183637.1 4-(cytidine 5'-diphospho)-2-C-methyl-D-erythritol kinase [Rhizobium sp. E27B/91]QXZ83957.1 4-(cytidine 5'-di